MTDKKECCGSCRFFSIPEYKDHDGNCHRFPPKFVTVLDIVDAYFVAVGRDWWCGEYQPKKEAE